MADKPRGWYCSEKVGFAFIGGCDLSLADWNRDKAHIMVAAGTHRWKCGQSMRLVLAPITDQLSDFEFWLEEISPGRFQKVEW